MAKQNAKVRVMAVASRQFGRIASRQLQALSVAPAVVNRWVNQGYLHPKLPSVYAVGHDAPSIEGDLAAALLYAGPGAMLSHETAAWWFGLIERQPPSIHVSSPHRCRSRPSVRVHERRDCQAIWHRALPATTVAQSLLDYARTASLNQVRVALAKAEYHHLLNVPAVEDLLGRGRPGSSRLRQALTRHQPRLAYTRSRTERAFLALCEAWGLPVPKVNVRIGGWTVDFLWPEHSVVVEVDGHGNHHTPAQIDRDRRKDLAMRAHGLTVNRYSADQVEQSAALIASDVMATLMNHSSGAD